MKNTSKQTQVFKLIASHLLVVAIFTQPWIVTIFADLINIIRNNGSESAFTADSILGSLTVLSGAALLLAALAFVGYLLFSKRDRKNSDTIRR